MEIRSYDYMIEPREKWIDNVKYLSPRPPYNHMAILDAIADNLKEYFNNMKNMVYLNIG